MKNMAEINMGLTVVSRDCFPKELAEKRRTKLFETCKKHNINLIELKTIVENEKDVLKVLDEIKNNKINSLVIYLGNFGPEGPTTMLAQKFNGPSMIIAAAEEDKNDLINGRGDAYCGMLNTSYSVGLRKINPYIPSYPVGIPEELAEKIKNFFPIARIIISLKSLKIFSFGPRPQDFLACNAPIKPLFDLGIEIMENSELDLYDIFLSNKNNPLIKAKAGDMAKELGKGNTYPELLEKLAQYELSLENFMEKNLQASKYGIFANKCWPSFEKYFEFVPCYINSRLASRGIPVSCEVDIYGVLSEYISSCATEMPSTILDINNTIPYNMYNEIKKDIIKDYKPNDLFMGFHCGNTPLNCMMNPEIKYQLIMHRLLESGGKPDITRGTLEGRIKPGKITIFRLQSTSDTKLQSYIAQGEILDINPNSFGSIAVFAVKEMARFYRYVLIEKKFPHHTAVSFAHTGKTLFAVLKMLGIENIFYNQPKGIYYSDENPFV
ncbi:MAG: fucose isomerase [Spirochaetes bacterium]|nr:fucose isomerase [Spirochaetota bacterium]